MPKSIKLANEKLIEQHDIHLFHQNVDSTDFMDDANFEIYSTNVIDPSILDRAQNFMHLARTESKILMTLGLAVVCVLLVLILCLSYIYCPQICLSTCLIKSYGILCIYRICLGRVKRLEARKNLADLSI
jgi:hypothetical protein